MFYSYLLRYGMFCYAFTHSLFTSSGLYSFTPTFSEHIPLIAITRCNIRPGGPFCSCRVCARFGTSHFTNISWTTPCSRLIGNQIRTGEKIGASSLRCHSQIEWSGAGPFPPGAVGTGVRKGLARSERFYKWKTKIAGERRALSTLQRTQSKSEN